MDVAFWGGVVPGNADCLRPLLQRGLPGFKCFLIHSGVDEFPHVTPEEVETALQRLQGTGAVLLVGNGRWRGEGRGPGRCWVTGQCVIRTYMCQPDG